MTIHAAKMQMLRQAIDATARDHKLRRLAWSCLYLPTRGGTSHHALLGYRRPWAAGLVCAKVYSAHSLALLQFFRKENTVSFLFHDDISPFSCYSGSASSPQIRLLESQGSRSNARHRLFGCSLTDLGSRIWTKQPASSSTLPVH